MADLDLSVLVSRTLLGLPDLEINDFVDYYLGPEFLGGQEQFNRTQVGSPFLDSQVTTYRQRQNVSETIQVECLGGDLAELSDNVLALKEAFGQDRYTLTVTIGGRSVTWLFEAADSVTPVTGPRLIENQIQVSFTAQRQSHPVSGALL